MSAMVVPLAILAGLVLLGRLVLPGRSRVGAFNPRRANLRARSATGGNALLMLASIQLATLGFELIESGASTNLSENTVGLVVPLVIIVGIVMLVVNRSFADAVIGLLGV